MLAERGLSGATITALKSMYAKDKACVLTQDGVTELFRCTIGVKQGCPASPLLFGLYIDQLEQLLREACLPPTQQGGGGQGTATPPIDAPCILDQLIPLLLFADDLALFSLSHAGLQAQLDILQDFCTSRGLVVNVSKTKIMIFEHKHTDSPAFHIGGEEVARVEAFKYLGILFHETRGMSCAIEQLVASARKALFAMHADCRRLRIVDPRLRCQLFDALVRPILSYACEIWVPLGGKSAMQKLEQVHRGFLKSLLGVPQTTTSKFVYAELARAPLKHFCWQQCIKYLHRLHLMDDNRLLKKAFVAACSHRSLWRRGVDLRLQKLAIPPLDPHEDFDVQKIIKASNDMYSSWMMTADSDSPSQAIYFSFKRHFRMEPYIWEAKNSHLRKIIARFRTGNHWLQVNVGRYTGVAREQRFCTRCTDVVEDELHAIFDCPDFDLLRCKFSDLFSGCSDLYSFLCHSPVHRLALFLTECRAARMPHSAAIVVQTPVR